MKLDYVSICGFRGYCKPLRIEFGHQVTIIDGRNGVGKSTVFDAVEFALTGQLSKYLDAKASGETVADYLWWTGEVPTADERYVEVGFSDGEEHLKVRRDQLSAPDHKILVRVESALCDIAIAPSDPLKQLCASSIIRDEHITRLSLDLTETDRYALLRDALGANDSAAWTSRAAEIVSLAKKRLVSAQQDVNASNAELGLATKRMDEIRASLASDSVIQAAALRLQQLTGSNVAADQIAGPARQRLADLDAELANMKRLASEWAKGISSEASLLSLREELERALNRKDVLTREMNQLGPSLPTNTSSKLVEQATALMTLVTLGRALGLRDSHCPLCDKQQTETSFMAALAEAEARAQALNAEAADAAKRQQQLDLAATRLQEADRAIATLQAALQTTGDFVSGFTERRVSLGLAEASDVTAVQARISEKQLLLESAEKDLRVLDTLKLNEALERAQKTEHEARARVIRTQERSGVARRAEAQAHALHDAARRSASETLDGRLERVLPLMSELYRRLRPHPIWSDIEYSVRGDVRRFLKLQVGGSLNPQFIFSSGQRRATGLAFLLSVNLSLAWSRWRTVLLDDPVQHVDDFRSIHLAELMAHLVSSGRQVICAVEDASLAEMLARRLPVGQKEGSAKRITLGPDTDGMLVKRSERWLVPHVRDALFAGTSGTDAADNAAA